jgi:hypothetical protein
MNGIASKKAPSAPRRTVRTQSGRSNPGWTGMTGHGSRVEGEPTEGATISRAHQSGVQFQNPLSTGAST